MAAAAKGEKPKIPANKLIDVPAVKMTKRNVNEVWKKYEAQLSEGNKYLESTKQN